MTYPTFFLLLVFVYGAVFAVIGHPFGMYLLAAAGLGIGCKIAVQVFRHIQFGLAMRGKSGQEIYRAIAYECDGMPFMAKSQRKRFDDFVWSPELRKTGWFVPNFVRRAYPGNQSRVGCVVE